MSSFRAGEYDKIEIVYNEFKNVATQILRGEQFLPVLQPKKDQKAAQTDSIYLPNQDEIVIGMVPKALKIQLFKSILDSNAAENGARMTAMDKATENAGEIIERAEADLQPHASGGYYKRDSGDCGRSRSTQGVLIRF